MATQPLACELRSQFLNDAFQRRLAHWNRERLSPEFPTADWQSRIAGDAAMLRLEGGFLEELREEVIDEAAAAPTDPDGFIAWFEDLKQTGPGQGDPLFPWIAEGASRDELRWFLEQEAAGEAGFDDLVALTQVKLPTRPKLELARNYWDEMGHGQAKGMHGPMLDALVETLAHSLELAGGRDAQRLAKTNSFGNNRIDQLIQGAVAKRGQHVADLSRARTNVTANKLVGEIECIGCLSCHFSALCERVVRSVKIPVPSR